jgi:hypothetical protein
MRVVLAHQGDQLAEQLVALLGADACRLTPRDLSKRGWQHHPTCAGMDTLPIGEHVLAASEITAVITRIAAVSVRDLTHIVEEDRDYVASEMTSFLLSFLTQLECPVINRPSAGSLMGPSWTQIRWRVAATRAGFALSTREDEPGQVITIVGDRVLGADHPRMIAAARALSREANATLLALRVARSDRTPLFIAAEPWATVSAESVAALGPLLERGVA